MARELECGYRVAENYRVHSSEFPFHQGLHQRTSGVVSSVRPGWTSTVLLLDYDGKERERLEGYLPNQDFVAALEGLGGIAFVPEKYTDAEVGTPTR